MWVCPTVALVSRKPRLYRQDNAGPFRLEKSRFLRKRKKHFFFLHYIYICTVANFVFKYIGRSFRVNFVFSSVDTHTSCLISRNMCISTYVFVLLPVCIECFVLFHICLLSSVLLRSVQEFCNAHTYVRVHVYSISLCSLFVNMNMPVHVRMFWYHVIRGCVCCVYCV